MEVEKAYLSGLELVEDSKIVMVSNNGEDGYPYTKAMMRLKHDGLYKFWLSTNTSSKRVQLFKNDNRANLYFVDENSFKGLMLVGTIEVLQDRESKEMLWSEGCEIYYPLGIDDPDYTVLCFTAAWGSFYQGLENTGFKIDEK